MQVKKCSLILSATALLLLLPQSLRAQESNSDPAATPAAPAARAAASNAKPLSGKPVYKPPVGIGAPAIRVGGGSRGDGADASVLALVPDHAALTSKAQPSLFWFQSKPAKARLELTLTEPKKVQPLLRLQSATAHKAGIQRLRLSSHTAELAPNVSYKWSVALVTDEKNRSKDVVASGIIKRVPKSDELAAKLEAASAAERPFVYASAGLWYDALEAISDLVDANPKEPAFRAQRAALLQQIGLSEAAAESGKVSASAH